MYFLKATLVMGKFSCCVPDCTNNWRSTPNMKFHTLPGDQKVRKVYKKLVRNESLKEFAQNTRICGSHFPGGERMCRTQLPSIFPWSSIPVSRRSLEKHDLPIKSKKRLVMEPTDNASSDSEGPSDKQPETDDSLHEPAGELDCCDLEPANNAPVIDEQEESQEVKDLKAEVMSLKSINTFLQKELLQVRCEIDSNKTKPKFDIDDYKDTDDKISFFTGFPNYDTMVLCFDLIKEKAANLSYGSKIRINFDPDSRKHGTKRKLTLWQEFTMVLMRLRLGLFAQDLSERFRVSASTVSTINRTWIRFLRKELEPICIHWPTKQQLQYYMPPVFKSFYPNLVSIIDCTEIQMESPSSLDKRSLCYSSYKSRTTMKALVGITPNGVLSFSSELFCGSISDPDIVKKSGFLTHLNKGDLVMADKGFTIQDELATVGARLAIPHFLKGKRQFTKQESDHNKKIASLRIHVERYMERLKNWHYFDRPIPITQSDIASDAWVIVACLSNFLPPIVS